MVKHNTCRSNKPASGLHFLGSSSQHIWTGRCDNLSLLQKMNHSLHLCCILYIHTSTILFVGIKSFHWYLTIPMRFKQLMYYLFWTSRFGRDWHRQLGQSDLPGFFCWQGNHFLNAFFSMTILGSMALFPEDTAAIVFCSPLWLLAWPMQPDCLQQPVVFLSAYCLH